MRAIGIIILIVFCVGNLSAQNIIPNPSFEDTVLRTTPLFLPNHWIAPTDEGFNYYTPLHNDKDPNWGSPDNANGFQVAKSGNSYIGIRVYDLYQNIRSGVREYAQVKLTTPLDQDSVYCLRLYMSMADSAVFASKNQMGVYFSTNAVNANNAIHLPYTPQIIISPDSFNKDKENWVEYNFEYQAAGGERYMTVGNFNDTNSLDTMFVGGGNQFWMEASYYYLDNFYLGSCDSLPEDTSIGLRENVLKRQISVYPNPTEDQLYINYKGNEALQIRLFDLMGKQIQLQTYQQKNQHLLSLGHLPKGLYFLEIVAGKNRISKKILKD